MFESDKRDRGKNKKVLVEQRQEELPLWLIDLFSLLCYTSYVHSSTDRSQEEFIMRCLLSYADRFVQKCNWKDFGLLKACLFSFGIFAGTFIPRKKVSCVRTIALTGFVATLVPIMTKFFKVITDEDEAV